MADNKTVNSNLERDARISGEAMCAFRKKTATGVALIMVGALACGKATGAAPYPASPVITGIEWAPAETIVRRAPGSDNWPVTWADDDAIYSTWETAGALNPGRPQNSASGLRASTAPPLHRQASTSVRPTDAKRD
jgi:hypothetical protein